MGEHRCIAEPVQFSRRDEWIGPARLEIGTVNEKANVPRIREARLESTGLLKQVPYYRRIRLAYVENGFALLDERAGSKALPLARHMNHGRRRRVRFAYLNTA